MRGQTLSNAVPADAAAVMAQAGARIAQAARLTLIGMRGGRGLGALALMTTHSPDARSPHVAYATPQGCFYGRGFLKLDRFEQAFVVAHEVLHRQLGHIERGEIMRRSLPDFSPTVFNIACDAIINQTLKELPRPQPGLLTSHGIKMPAGQARGVLWEGLVAEARKLATQAGTELEPVFQQRAESLAAEQIYHALMHSIRAVARQLNFQCSDTAAAQHPAPDEGGEPPGEGTLIKRLAHAVGAHEDLQNTDIQGASDAQLRDGVRRRAAELNSVLHGLEPGDALRKLTPLAPTLRTPWQVVLRSRLNRALVARPEFNRRKVSRRTLAGVAMAEMAGDRRRPVPAEPRFEHWRPGKRLAVVVDTSGSIDDALLARFLGEVKAILRRTAAAALVIFADAKVRNVLRIDDAISKLDELVVKGGGGTDFRPAFARAAEFQPDILVYFTDLVGTFPEKKPGFPVVWVHPAEADTSVPFGQKLALH